MSRKVIPLLIIALASMWLGWTILVDFFIAPTLFQNIDDFFQAGFLGLIIFTKLNYLEVIVASGIVGLCALQTQKGLTPLLLLLIALILFSIAMFYFSYLTPKIQTITELWKKADLMGLSGLSGIPDLQQEQQFYHRLYITIDSIKLILLLSFLGLFAWRGKTWI